MQPGVQLYQLVDDEPGRRNIKTVRRDPVFLNILNCLIDDLIIIVGNDRVLSRSPLALAGSAQNNTRLAHVVAFLLIAVAVVNDKRCILAQLDEL